MFRISNIFKQEQAVASQRNPCDGWRTGSMLRHEQQTRDGEPIPEGC